MSTPQTPASGFLATPNPTLLALENVLVKTYPGGKSHIQFANIIMRALAARGFKIVPINEPTTPTYECMACGTTWTAQIDVCPTCQDAAEQAAP